MSDIRLLTKNPVAMFGAILAIALGSVGIIWLLTNHMQPEWDMHYYIDMATHGVIGNKDLAAPFAYRLGAPLLVGLIANVLHCDPETTFRICNALMCILFVVSCFYFARSFGASFDAAAFSGLSLSLYFFVTKWTLFSGTMVDIYAYPLLLFAFWALITDRFYLCLVVSGIALFFKEFALLPLLTQTGALTIRTRVAEWRKLVKPLSLALLVILSCFVLPRFLIHVKQTFQDIDPINQASTLRRLISYPLSRRHDFNIVFAYLSGWLPVLLLMNVRRWKTAWTTLRQYRVIFALYMAGHFALTMYGGTNIDIYITFCAPIQILVLIAILDKERVPYWEMLTVLLIVFMYNRIWSTVPLPKNGLDAYLDFYGGYYMRVTPRSLMRMVELLSWIVAMWGLRFLVSELPSRERRSLARAAGVEVGASEELS
ncbi:MAG: hypothetical protein ACJ746_29955 [Bryobacteraceae bacterium]